MLIGFTWKLLTFSIHMDFFYSFILFLLLHLCVESMESSRFKYNRNSVVLLGQEATIQYHPNLNILPNIGAKVSAY